MGMPKKQECRCGVVKTEENTSTYYNIDGKLQFISRCKKCERKRAREYSWSILPLSEVIKRRNRYARRIRHIDKWVKETYGGQEDV